MRRFGIVLGLALVGGPLQEAARADNLDLALLKHAPDLIEGLFDKGYRTVGVLPFRVQLPQSQGGRVQPLSGNLADRVENALVMLLPTNEKKVPVTVLHRAGKAAADRDRDATNASPEGRKKLFAAAYPVAWGKARAKPDVFLTGTARFTDDLERLVVSVGYFDDKMDKVQGLKSIQARVDRQMLADAGLCFALPASRWRRPKATSDELDSLAVKQALDRLEKRTRLEKPSFELEIRTGDRSQPLQLTAGPSGHLQAAVGSPYVLGLRRSLDGDFQLGVVLKVGGRSLWQGETAQLASCRRWLYARKSAKGELYKGVYAGKSGEKIEPLRPPSPGKRPFLAGVGDNLLELAVLASGPEGYEEGGRVCCRGLAESERTEEKGTLGRLQVALMRRSGVKVSRTAIMPRRTGGLLLADLEAEKASAIAMTDFPRPMLVEYTRVELAAGPER